MSTFDKNTRKTYSNEELLDMLQSSDKQVNNVVLEYLYRQVERKVQRFIQNNSGRLEDAQDIFQEGLFALFKSAQQLKLHDGIVVEPYFYTICKYLWWKKLDKQERFTSVKDDLKSQLGFDSTASFEVSKVETEEQRQRLELVLQRLGKDCHRL